MTSVRSLRAARGTYSVALKNYLNSRKKADYIHIFLENQADPSYYLYHISQYIDPSYQIKVYRCINKRNVEQAGKALNNGIGIRRNVYLFVDRDYDDFTDHKKVGGIYYTDFYSIESELDNNQVLSRIWNSFFHNLPKSETSVNFVIRWRRLMKQFTERLARFVFPAVIQFRKDNTKGNLGNLSIKPAVYTDQYGHARIKLGQSTAILRAAIPHFINANRHLSRDVRNMRKQVAGMNPLYYIRGKQLFELLMLFLKIEKERMQKKYTTAPKFKSDIEFSPSTPFSLLASLTNTPQSMATYISDKIIP